MALYVDERVVEALIRAERALCTPFGFRERLVTRYASNSPRCRRRPGEVGRRSGGNAGPNGVAKTTGGQDDASGIGIGGVVGGGVCGLLFGRLLPELQPAYCLRPGSGGSCVRLVVHRRRCALRRRRAGRDHLGIRALLRDGSGSDRHGRPPGRPSDVRAARRAADPGRHDGRPALPARLQAGLQARLPAGMQPVLPRWQLRNPERLRPVLPWRQLRHSEPQRLLPRRQLRHSSLQVERSI